MSDLAVADYSFALHASHLQQSHLVNHPGPESFIKAADISLKNTLNIYCQHLLPFGRADLSTSILLQPIRGRLTGAQNPG
jgi:hypothetical protein